MAVFDQPVCCCDQWVTGCEKKVQVLFADPALLPAWPIKNPGRSRGWMKAGQTLASQQCYFLLALLLTLSELVTPETARWFCVLPWMLATSPTCMPD